MSQNSIARWALAVMLTGALFASPADAQGKAKGKDKKDRERPELVRREEALREDGRRRSDAQARDRYEEDDRYDDDRYGNDRYESRQSAARQGANRQGVPRGWCQGKGNPHNTVENCGYSASRNTGRYDDRVSTDRRYDDRSGSYAQEHEEFHRWLDRKYSDMAAQRPLDIQWQLRVRTEKKAEHDRWHAQAGRRHE